MNTKNKQDQKGRAPKKRQEHGTKKQVSSSSIYQEHERPELRLTR
jgi:hypothetical protein